MDAKRVALGTLAGALTLFLAGYAVFGLMFPRFYMDFMRAGSATDVAREPFLIWPIAIAMLSYALLITLAIARASDRLTMAAGMKIGAIVSFLVWFTADFMLYGISNVGNLALTLADPLLEAVPGALAGSVIAAVLRPMSLSRAGHRRAA